MAMLETVRKETHQLLSKLGLSGKDMMGTNFRAHGAELGIYDYEDFVRYARRIYQEAMRNPEGFTLLELPKKQLAIDFQGKLRGVYNRYGDPIAFFKPNYEEMGFSSYREELREFKNSVNAVLS